MFTAGGSPGEVHSYFSPYPTPMDAFITSQAAVQDFEMRLRLYTVAANEPFLFYTGHGEENFTNVKAYSLKGFISAVSKVNLKSIEFHNEQGDFEKWADLSLNDKVLANEFRKISLSGCSGETLRRRIYEAALKRYCELQEAIRQTAFF